MNVDEAREFIRRHKRGVICVRRPDGRISASPVVAGVDEDGTLLISSTEATLKARILRSDPYAMLCVLREEFFPPWCWVEGTVAVEPLPGAMETLVRYFRLVSGEHPDWDEYRAAMAGERRLILRFSIERAGPS